MTISPARMAANRANAAKSTGPRTIEGKARSRVNGLKHGLRALVVPVEDEATIRTRAVGVFDTIRPQNEYQAWLCGLIALRTVQLDRLNVIRRQTRDDAVHRAAQFWDEDQDRDARRIAGGMDRDPGRTVGLLRRTVAGCAWLIERWAHLASLAGRASWTDEQKNLAHDLIGTPQQFRSDPPTYLIDEYGVEVVPAPTELQLAQAHLAELHQCRVLVDDTDEAARTLAMADLNDFGDRDQAIFRRYERSLMNDLNRAADQARYESPKGATNSQFFKSIPAQFFSSPPPTSPSEPIIAAPIEPMIAAPSEPRAAELVAIVPLEPETAPAQVAPTEPIIEAPSEPKIVEPSEPKTVAPSEPKIVAPSEPKTVMPTEPKLRPPVAPRRPVGGSFAGAFRIPEGTPPELRALLEADLPNPDTLDPAWCREFITAQMGIDPARVALPVGPPTPFSSRET